MRIVFATSTPGYPVRYSSVYQFHWFRLVSGHDINLLHTLQVREPQIINYDQTYTCAVNWSSEDCILVLLFIFNGTKGDEVSRVIALNFLPVQRDKIHENYVSFISFSHQSSQLNFKLKTDFSLINRFFLYF